MCNGAHKLACELSGCLAWLYKDFWQLKVLWYMSSCSDGQDHVPGEGSVRISSFFAWTFYVGVKITIGCKRPRRFSRKQQNLNNYANEDEIVPVAMKTVASAVRKNSSMHLARVFLGH